MTYLQFLLVFLIPPIALLSFYFKKSKRTDKTFYLKGVTTLCTLAFIWTTPWDNYLVATNIWGYGADRVLITIGYVPIEEYTFFFLQTIMTGLWCFLITSKLNVNENKTEKQPVLGLSILVGLFFLGVYSLFFKQSTYLGLILSWAMPICLLQWSIGGKYLLANLKQYLACIAPPTVYLWLADFYAIKDDIWYISEETILGIKFGHLPLEEATFFLVTNMMVAQGLILFQAMRKELPEMKRKLSFKLGKNGY